MLHGSMIAPDESQFAVSPSRVTEAGSGPDGGQAGFVVIPDAHLLFNCEFTRIGNDLKLVGEDGKTFVVQDYFKTDRPPALVTPEGAHLSGETIDAIAGDQAPGQYAQAGAQPGAGEAIGKVATSAGNATIVRNGVAITVNAGDVILKNDVLRTGGDGALGVIFNDGTTFSLTANAQMVVNEFVYQEGGANNQALFSLVRGSISFFASQVAKTGDMKVATPDRHHGHPRHDRDRRHRRRYADARCDRAGQYQALYRRQRQCRPRRGVCAERHPARHADAIGHRLLDPAGRPAAGDCRTGADQPGGSRARPRDPAIVVQFVEYRSAAPATAAATADAQSERPRRQQYRAAEYRRGRVEHADRHHHRHRQHDNDAGRRRHHDRRSITDVKITQPDGTTTPVITNPGQTPPPNTPPETLPDTTPPPIVVDNIIIRGDGDDSIVGTAGNDDIYAGGGDDTIYAAAGNDDVFGEDGDDILIAGEGAGNDNYDGGEGSDWITFTSTSQGVVVDLEAGTATGAEIGSDTLVDIENVTGGTGNDSITGTADVNILVGLGGADTIDGGGGADVILGGDGNDLILVRDGVGWTIDGGDRHRHHPADGLIRHRRRERGRPVRSEC